MVSELELLFPKLRGAVYRMTSPKDKRYNCIAHAGRDVAKRWWPDPDGVGYWPESATRAETLLAFQEAFASLGYVPCSGEELEAGWEKVALFVAGAGVPTHACRQLRDGWWTSKLGTMEDIEHRLRDLEGDVYGTVGLILKRLVAPARLS